MWDYYTTRGAQLIGSSSYTNSLRWSESKVTQSTRVTGGTISISQRTGSTTSEAVTSHYGWALNPVSFDGTQAGAGMLARAMGYDVALATAIISDSFMNSGFSSFRTTNLRTTRLTLATYLIASALTGATLGRSTSSVVSFSSTVSFSSLAGTAAVYTTSSTSSQGTTTSTAANGAAVMFTNSFRGVVSSTTAATVTLTTTAATIATATVPTVAAGTSTTTTAAFPNTTSSSVTSLSTVRSTAFTTYTATDICLDRIIGVESSEWGWIPTATDMNTLTNVAGDVSAVCTSFTEVTLTYQGSRYFITPVTTVTALSEDIALNNVPLGGNTFSVTKNLSSSTVTYALTISSATATITRSTSSTYLIESNTVLSFTPTASLQITTTSTVTHHLTSTSTYFAEDYRTYTPELQSYTAITTDLTGTRATTFTYNEYIGDNIDVLIAEDISKQSRFTTWSSNATVTDLYTSVGGYTQFAEVAGVSINHHKNGAFSSYAEPYPHFSRATHGKGYQDDASLGADRPYGTALSFASPVGKWAFGYRTDMGVALFSTSSTSATSTAATDTITISVSTTIDNGPLGPLPASITNWQSLSRFGGYAWRTTDSTVLSALYGKHAATLFNGTSTTSTIYDWTASTTASFAAGMAIFIERTPQIRGLLPMNNSTPVVTFSAFPQT